MGTALCPIYDNGSSLCCYIPEEKIDGYLGNDRVRLDSIINSKWKSRIRIDKKSKKEPTHLEMLAFLKSNFLEDVYDFVKKIKIKVDKDAIDNILDKYDESVVSRKRKELIRRFLNEKIRLMTELFNLWKKEEDLC